MRELGRSLLAEFQKTKRLPIRIMHFGIPVSVTVAFLAYYRYSPWNAYEKVAAYFQIMGIGFPFLIGLFCAMTSEQEQSAGGFQEMLAGSGRVNVFWGKLLLYILSGLFSVVFAGFLFGAVCPENIQNVLFEDRQRMILFDTKAALALWGSSLFLYILHLFLAFRFSESVSMVLGIIESLVSALFLTGMGDGIWMFVPASWASRMVTGLLLVESGGIIPLEEFKAAVEICVLLTVGGGVCFSIWCCCWEGKSGSD